MLICWRTVAEFALEQRGTSTKARPTIWFWHFIYGSGIESWPNDLWLWHNVFKSDGNDLDCRLVFRIGGNLVCG
jgi:hypothetical protein